MNVVPISGAREAPKSAQSRMETMYITPEMVNQWRIPAFQRPLRINDKVRAVSEKIKREEVIEGVITLGQIKREPTVFIVDGQHRLEAFKMSMLNEVIADIRYMTFDSVKDMAEEFDRLNSSLVKMRPDDNLRSLEYSVPTLALIRKHCEFVGYDQIRRGKSGPILSMSAVIRCWSGSLYETPNTSSAGLSARDMARNLDTKLVESGLVPFLNVALSAWGRDPEYARLWSNLNLAMCMWMWNKLVMDRDRSGSKRYITLNVAEFKRCLMSVSAESDYVAWLTGRSLGDRDRTPCYSRLKAIFVRRITAENPNKARPTLPAPAWAT